MKCSLRELQLCELQILKDVKKVCEKHGIRYYLSSGTLLGAVRHQGFIPWDDDIDIMMPFKEYQRFLEIAQTELGDSYFVQNSETDTNYAFAYTHIRKNNTAIFRDWDFAIRSHHGVWIDIFPLVFINGSFDRRIKDVLLKVCYFLRMPEDSFLASEGWIISQSNKIIVFFIKLARKIPPSVRNRIRNSILGLIYKKKRGRFISHIWTKVTNPVPYNAYNGEPVNLRFENDNYPAPTGYDQVLSTSYGDYMTPPPENQRNGGHGDFVVIDLEHDWTYYYEDEEQSALEKKSA